ncbi:MAG: hypothetical protein ACOX9C_00375 [Kiritimatiellia bacterium]|jgi:photosystem II stability/assembly factor-like uncharacterized protein
MKDKLKHIATASCAIAAICLATAACALQKANTKWTWAGWGGGGYFWSAVIDPSNADIMYLGGDVVGMYKSTDRGKNWSFINNGVNNYGVYGLAIAPNSPRTLYAMSVDGIVRTTDGGASWTPLPDTLKGKLNLSAKRYSSVRPIAVHPANANVVYAGSGAGAAYVSINGGQSWTELDYRAALADAPADAVAPASGAGFLWARLDIPANDWKHHGRLERYYATPQDWSACKTFSAAIYTPAAAPALKVALVVQSGSSWTWQNGDFATTQPGRWVPVTFNLGGLENPSDIKMAHIMIRSEGQAFKGEIGIDAVRLLPADASAPSLPIGEWDAPGSNEGWRVSKAKDAPFLTAMRASLAPSPEATGPIASIILDPATPANVYICHRTLGVFKSADAGKTWRQLDTPKNASHLATLPQRPGALLGAFEKDGVWKSADGGTTWTKCAGLPEDVAQRELAVDPRDANVIHLIGNRSWTGFHFRSSDGGATWTSSRAFTRDLVGNPTDPDDAKTGKKDLSATTNLAMSPTDPDTIFISANWNNIITTDGGLTWRESSRGADITCFHDLRFANGRVFASAMDEGLLTSADNGATWTQLWPRKYTLGESGHHWRNFAFQKADGEFHIVSTVSPWRGAQEFPNHLVVSGDSGKTFTHATGLPTVLPRKNVMWGEGYARALAADPADPLTMYLGIDGDPEPERGFAGGGVFKSTDGGRSWTQLANQPGTRRMFYGLAVDPANSKRIFWGGFGTNGGVWRSEDGGESWQRMNGPDAYLFNVEAANNGIVYAGGNELWKSADHGTTWKKISNIPNRKGSVVGIAWDPQDARRIWFSSVTWDGSDQGGIYRSDDGGGTWIDITGDIPYRKPLVLRYNATTRELWAAGVGAFRTRQPSGALVAVMN